MQIRDSMLKSLLLTYIVSRIESMEIDELIDDGFSPELLENLRHRTAGDVANIGLFDIPLAVTIDPATLTAALESFDDTVQRVSLMDYFLQHGTQADVVATLFHQSTTDVRARARLIANKRSELKSRIRDDDDVHCIALHEHWPAVCVKYAETRHRLYYLHKKLPGFTIDALIARVEADFGSYMISPKAFRNGTHVGS
ncbi:STY4526/YPO1902 family pathogenicity island replication protein [Nitrogeniibacter aestuarii]|uniref:STY4526/YPO1902 family pathogenicity island replication protein n=1 Tax=Nitrogeniibacter aestuarii TaxID=2815343 RepID=UPI001E5FD945|nr:STY4526/YPO1902 family pathogenicity island replication protein [Nitrogeniibacter aestuarii]